MIKFILNADDFGMSKAHNKAVLEGFKKGFLTSCSLCANGEEFDEAVNVILPQCQGISLGVHLNIIEGKSLINNKEFKDGYLNLILKSFDKNFLKQIEIEFRAQIEKIASKTKITHIDSHVHTHAIPNIFEISAKLAHEYNIPYIRTQYERIYIVPSFKKHLTIKYPINLLKIILLNSFTLKNRKIVKKYNLKTNDYLIGVGYTGMMDENTLYYGIKPFKTYKENKTVEALIHPRLYENDSIEFLMTQNEELKNKIQEMFEI